MVIGGSNLPPGFDPQAAGCDEPSDDDVVRWALRNYPAYMVTVLKAIGTVQELADGMVRLATNETSACTEEWIVRAAAVVRDDFPVEFNDALTRRRRG